MVVRRRRQHLDVGPGAEHLVQAAGEHHRLDLGVLEAQPLDDVGQLDVDAQVVGVELELVAVAEPPSGSTAMVTVATGPSTSRRQCRYRVGSRSKVITGLISRSLLGHHSPGSLRHLAIVYIVVTVRQEAVERQLWGRWAPWKPGQSAPSARALLLTLLGEFVLPDGGRAWAATLIEALSLLDVEARTARQAIARTARAGLLASERSGRRVAGP